MPATVFPLRGVGKVPPPGLFISRSRLFTPIEILFTSPPGLFAPAESLLVSPSNLLTSLLSYFTPTEIFLTSPLSLLAPAENLFNTLPGLCTSSTSFSISTKRNWKWSLKHNPLQTDLLDIAGNNRVSCKKLPLTKRNFVSGLLSIKQSKR